MKKIFYSFTLLFLLASLSAKAVPSLQIQGENYDIAPLTQGTQIFLNRTGMLLKAIPSDYTGWKVTRINGNSTYLPGPKASFQVKADKNGYIFAMVANVEDPDICAQWASDNEWTLILDQKLYYGDVETQAFAFYKKVCIKDQWVTINQPNVFSGAVIIAPNITEDSEALAAVPVSIKAIGSMETATLNNGVIAYSNRSYVFNSVKKELKGLVFTRYAGNAIPIIDITAEETGDMYIAVSNEDTSYDPIDNGWTEVSGLEFGYNDLTSTIFSVYKKSVTKDEVIKIKATGFQGVLVLASAIEYTTISNITPPPGVVIHNSKANTKIYIGSPSIVVLENGSYLASHDYFGTTTESFVYRSDDKGKTWARISTISKLKWATIFRRANEIYLLGVQVEGTEYGNTVILKSTDDGVNWTNPTNNTTGLLLQGYYHCAPVPVVEYNGKYWRAMEDQGSSGGWGNFKSFMMSADQDSDLLNASSWTSSNKLTFSAGPNNYGSAWLEGNAVVDRTGAIKNILRVHYGGDNIAAKVSVSADGKTSSFNSSTDFINLPGATKKFTIRYDSISDKYWTLSNYALEESLEQSSNKERIRNTVVLSWSDDLTTWNIKDTLLHHPNVSNHGFQYLDWLFEGNDIIAVSRTAWEDETGAADSQHNANFITFHRFKNFRYERNKAESGITVKQWYQNKKSAIALTFDDGFKAHYDHAFPILEEYGIKGTFFVNSSNIVNKGATPIERYGFWDDFKKIAEAGHEVSSHSLTHANLSTADYDVLLNELQKDKENIESNVGKPCLTLAYPFCLHNEEVDALASTLFIAGRECGNLHNNPSLKGDEWYSVNSDLLTWGTPRSLANEETNISKFKTKVQNEVIANEKFGVACIHEVLPFDQLSTSNTYEIATTQWLTATCAFLKEKQEAGDIWATTFANIVRYAKERDNLRINKTIVSENELKYEFSTLLDSDIFNLPLSISITVPEGWGKLTCEIWEGEQMSSTVDYEDGTKSIDMEIAPDQQFVILKKQSETDPDGLNENHFNQITCYPNPAKNILYVQTDELNGNGFCSIYNSLGACVLKSIYTPTSPIDIKSLNEGMYVVVIDSQGKTYSSKFLKQNQ